MAEVLLGVLRLAHALAAATWIGGTLTYGLCGMGAGASSLPPNLWRPFREALRVAIGIFLLTGAILTVDRLGSVALTPFYLAVLGLKVALSFWMFSLGRGIGRAAGGPWWRRVEWQILALGAVVYGLALVLRGIFEEAIRG
jgi:hypothetical protein